MALVTLLHQSLMASSLAVVPSQTRPLVSMIQLTSPAFGLLHDHPVRVVEADGAARLQVVDAELRAGLALLGGAERREAQHIGRLLVEELGEAPLEVVVGGDVVEDGLLRHERRQVAPPTERLGLGQPEVGLVELDGAPLDGQLGDLAGEVLGDALLDLQPREVGTK